MQIDEEECVARTVMAINTQMKGVYVFSSGKNMGVFKAVGFPEDVGHFYRLEDYAAYSWTAHGRYPTNTPGWWGGAHPFALLDRSIVHNGEISSYDANRRFMEMFGYRCTLQTDTEVITYIADYLLRRQELSLEELSAVIAAPFWSTIETKGEAEQTKLRYLRTVFSSLLITGPFSIILGFTGGLMALNDRLKLRSLVVAEKDDKVLIASEEAAIRAMEPDAENLFAPAGGEPYLREAVRQRGPPVRCGKADHGQRREQMRQLPAVRLLLSHSCTEDTKEQLRPPGKRQLGRGYRQGALPAGGERRRAAVLHGKSPTFSGLLGQNTDQRLAGDEPTH